MDTINTIFTELGWDSLEQGIESVSLAEVENPTTMRDKGMVKSVDAGAPWIIPNRKDPASCDPNDPLTCSSEGFEDKVFEKLMRFDLRDVYRFVGEKKWRHFAPKIASLPLMIVLNLWLGLMAVNFDEYWLRAIDVRNGLDDRESFAAAAEDLTICSKRGWMKEGTNYWFSEMEGFQGYRLESVDDGYDVREEISKFLSGTVEWSDNMRNAYKQATSSMVLKRKPGLKSFESFISDADWSTTGGAALTGITEKPEYAVEGKEQKLRLAKNRMIYVSQPEQMIHLAKKSLGIEISVAQIKSELQKKRMIWNFFFYGMLTKSYVLSWVKDLNYETTTLEISGEKQMTWYVALCSKCGIPSSRFVAYDAYSLPLSDQYGPYQVTIPSRGVYRIGASFDWKKFDFQVSNFEITEFWEYIGSVFVEMGGDPSFKDGILAGIENSWVLIPGKDKSTPVRNQDILSGEFERAISQTEKVKRTSGLTSGTPETSMLGLRKNYAVMTIARACAMVAVQRLFRVVNVHVYIQAQGDDSIVIISGDRLQCECVLKVFWQVMNKFGVLNPKKSIITRGEQVSVEFLRQRIGYFDGKVGVRGLPMRVLVSAGCRKPISTPSVDFMTSTKDMYTLAQTAVRRGASRNVIQFVEQIAMVQMDKRAVDREWFVTPTKMGGLGCGVPGSVAKRYSTVRQVSITHKFNLVWAASINKSRLAYVKQLSDQEALAVTDLRTIEQLTNTWNEETASFTRNNFPILEDETEFKWQVKSQYTLTQVLDSAVSEGFGSQPGLAARYQNATDIAKALRISKPLDLIHPSLVGIIKTIEKKFALPRKLAVDFLSGSLSVNEIGVNGNAKWLVDKVAAGILATSWGPRDSHTAHMKPTFASIDAAKILSQTLDLYAY